MGTHMKTTVEISTALIRSTRKIVAQEGTTLRALIEEGLRKVLADRARRAPFRLRDASVDGNGTHGDVSGRSWDATRDAIYEGRGS
jgi:hypothetical protein